MDRSKTVFITPLSGSDTKVYKISTVSSVYLLGLLEVGGRRFAVLIGQPGTHNAGVVMRDSDPQIGERSLWDVPDPQGWIGELLTVATLRTSTIQAVVLDLSPQSNAAMIRATQGSPIEQPIATSRATAILTGQRSSSTSGEQAEEAAYQAAPITYPESYVDNAETAASYLRYILRRSTLFEDVASNPVLQRRLDVALADCVVCLERLAANKRR